MAPTAHRSPILVTYELLHTWPGTRRRIGRLVVTALTIPLVFRFEEDLEDYLEAHLSLLGQDLLIIGRQVKVVGGLIDLLAIDPTGVIYVIELKLNGASPSVIAQVLGYRRSIKRLNREKIIRVVADGDLKIDLVEAFQRHFGHPLPEAANKSQVLVIIAASIHPKTADGILELLDEGYSVTTFRYVLQSDAVSLIPCCRSDQDVEEGSHAETRPSALPNRFVAPPHRSPICRVPVDENIRRFWLTHAQDFTPFVTFRFIYERYKDWVHAQTDEGVHLRQRGLFGRHLSAIISESNEWTRVFVALCSDMAAYDTFMAPPSARTYRAADHPVVAYQRNPIGRASEL